MDQVTQVESARTEQPVTPPTSPDVNPPDTSPPSEPSPDTSATASADPAALLKAFASKAKAAASATLDMGRLARDYITARMTLSDACQREACIKCLVGAWQEWSDNVITPVRINELIRAAAAWELFNAPTGFKPGKVALRVVREFSPLCERDVDQRAEVWRIVSPLEERARALWAEVVSKGLSGEETAAAVGTLIAQYHKELAAAAAEKASKPDASPEEKKAAEDAQKAAEKATEGASKKADRANKDKGKGKDGTPSPKPEAPCRGENLLATLAQTAKAGTSKDYASLLATAALAVKDPLALAFEMGSALATASKVPDDLLRALVDGMKASGSLSAPAVRACHAALTLLDRASKEGKRQAG